MRSVGGVYAVVWVVLCGACANGSRTRGEMTRAAAVGVGAARGAARVAAPPVASPLVLAHRGASGYRPEHTRAAYEMAIEQGADFIEPDVVPTRDGVLIVRHESELAGTTDVEARFPQRRSEKWIDGKKESGWFSEDFTLAEIKTLRARQAMPTLRSTEYDGRFEVMTLAEVMALASEESRARGRRIGLYIETKHPTYFAGIGLPLEDRLLALMRERGVPSATVPIFIQSFEPTILKSLHSRCAAGLILLIADEGRPYDLVAAGDGRSYRDLLSPAGLREIATYAQGIGPHKRLIVPADAQGTLQRPTSLIAAAHAAGLVVHPWTFRREAKFLAREYGGDAIAEMEQFLRLGADALFTDFPDLGVRARARLAGAP